MGFIRSIRRRLVIGGVCVLAGAGTVGVGSCNEIRIEMNAKHATKWTEVRTGSGPEAKPGMQVRVVYWLALPDGTRVVDLYAKDKTHPFRVGDGTVIAGLDEAVRGMRRGGIRDVTLPPIAHYGSAGYGGVIPKDTTLTMRLEMLDIRY